ncbi:casein kinase 1-like protein 3 [Ananas comosus]|uniref:non-specific serine/threonine protein kinase n=1 Tax=Ananas comosus TaxID=4615 RepID=A0A6P5G4X3_ANACO|nr:casein kinase 1-like protein 3 [Ananas comosus]
MDRIVGGKYKLGRKTGVGSSGEVYEATQIDTSELVAVKIEKDDTRRSELMVEAKMYNILRGKSGIPKIMWSGMDQGDVILVLELLGPNLKELVELCGGEFTLKTVLILAIRMIEILEYVHSKGFLHRDMKPENFVIGNHRRRGQIYIIDFGLATSYLDPATNCHIPCGKTTLTGTDLYASLHALLGNEQSRRDDLESLGFVFMYLLKGRLPWQGLRALSVEDMDSLIADEKRSPEGFCKSLPPEFRSYFDYCRSLKFDQQPDYEFLKHLFLDLLDRRVSSSSDSKSKVATSSIGNS